MNDLNILFVEDSDSCQVFYKILMTSLKYNFIITDGTKDIIKIIDKNNINLIFMDIGLNGICGFDLTKKIKQKYPNIPIIAITAYSTKETEQKCYQNNMIDFLIKPINKELLIDKIKKYKEKINDI